MAIQELSIHEIEQVSGGGLIGDICEDIKNADFIGAYEKLIEFASYAMERVMPYRIP